MKDRYSRQVLFAPIGKQGQANIQNAHVLIIGAGALGTASSEMLARAGVGTITIVDRDYVEESNLQRQQLYKEEDAKNKWPKAVAAKTRLQEVNSEIRINGLVADVTGRNIEELIKDTDVIVDATDNFETRMIVNDAAVKHKIPFLFGACVASYGLTFPIIPGKTPCLHCLIQHLPSQSMTCDSVGVISPIVQTVAAIQVTNVFKLLAGYPLQPFLQSIDIWTNEKAEINAEGLINPNCPTCGTAAEYPYLAYENHTKAEVLCGRNTIQIRPGMTRILSLENLSEQLQGRAGNIMVNSYLLSCNLEGHRIVFFKDGRALIHGTNDSSKARSLYNRIVG